MSYLGRSAKLSLKAQEKVSFLATAGQTSKTGLSYTPTFVEVYVNGVLLTDTTDFTATNGNSVTFTVALLLNDEVTVISLKTFTVADHYNKTEADTLLAAKSPLASPSFTGTVTADGLVVQAGNGATATLNLNNADGNGTLSQLNLGYTADPDHGNISYTGDMSFKTGGNVERMRIDNLGNVFIGDSTTAVTSKLVVSGNGTTDVATFMNDGQAGTYLDIDCEAANGAVVLRADARTGSYPPLTFKTSNTERMRIASNGNVGIGTSSPSAKIHATTATAGYAGKLINTNGASDANGLLIQAGTGLSEYALNVTNTAGTTHFMVVKGNGYVGIGTSSPSAGLDVAQPANLTEASPHIKVSGLGYSGYHWLDGTAYYIGQNSAYRSLRLYSGGESSGVNLANGGTSWGTFSDERLKFDIEPVENALGSLSNLRTVKYRLKDADTADSKKKIGLIAQDLVGVLDEIIDPIKRTDDETEYMSVRYTEIIPVLIKAIQEQQTIIELLTTRVETLEGEV